MKKIYDGDIIRELSVRVGISESVARQFLMAIKDLLTNHLADGNSVDLMGFGVFRCKSVGAKLLRNPQTGKRVRVKAHRCPAWRPSERVRNRVLEAGA